uniref:glucosaminidase domain-containing protein n=1 Tax=Neobacillus niacini TaxID=86668 RepID=UPI00187C4184
RLVSKGSQPPGSTDTPFLTTKPSVVYSTYVENHGWLNSVTNGEMSGAEGKSLRLEAIRISLKNSPFTGSISYRTHVQDYGWLDYVSNGETSGTTGKNKQVEAIQMNLTGSIAEHYDVYYRVYAENYGWLDWAKNGDYAGTQGFAKRLEAIEIVLVAKGGAAPGSTNNPFIINPSVVYSSHVQDYGWLPSVSDGKMSGTQGQSKRMEAIKISLNNAYPGDVTYSTHVQDYGWLNEVSNGALSGTSGQSKRLEAIKINLTGEMAQHYDIYYRVHAETYGWLDWAKNGEPAGTKGLSKRLEAIEIVLVAKGGAAPGSTKNPFIQSDLTNYYNITLNDALNMQMKVIPQTDKYKNAPAYVSSQYIKLLDTASISGSSVNLRTSPDLDNNTNVDSNVGFGTQFKVLDNNVIGDIFSGSTRWYKIEYNGKVLYVHSTFVSRLGQVTADTLNIRSEKSEGSHIYSKVTKDTLLTILEEDNSGWYRVNWGDWRNATSSDVLSYLDPTNFVNDEIQRFQFMDLTKTSGVSKEALNQYLVGKGILAGQGQAFIDAGNKYGINEVYLMAHTLLETGHGKSELAKGILYNGKIVYNMYGVGALDSCPIECGAKTAYEKGWFTPYDAIVGGAAFIDDGYTNGNNKYKVVQNTIYEMRWNPEVMATQRFAAHQYASDIGWAAKQVNTMYEVYKIQPYTVFLEIPVYK